MLCFISVENLKADLEVKKAILPDVSQVEFEAAWRRQIDHVRLSIYNGFPEVAVINLKKMISDYTNYKDKVSQCNKYLIEALVRSGDYDEVIKISKNIKSSFEPVSFFWLGVALYKTGNTREAAIFFQNFREHEKGNSKMVDYYRSASLFLSKYENDNNNLNKSIRLINDLYENYNEAKSSQNKNVLKTGKGDTIVENNLSDSSKKNQNDEDVDLSQGFVGHYNKHVNVLIRLYQASLLINSGNFKHGKFLLENVSTNLFNFEATRLILLSECLFNLGSIEESVNIYKELLQIFEKRKKNINDFVSKNKFTKKLHTIAVLNLAEDIYFSKNLEISKEKDSSEDSNVLNNSLAIKELMNFLISSDSLNDIIIGLMFDKLYRFGVFDKNNTNNYLSTLSDFNNKKLNGFIKYYTAVSLYDNKNYDEAIKLIEGFIQHDSGHYCIENSIYLLSKIYNRKELSNNEEKLMTLFDDLKLSQAKNFSSGKIDFLQGIFLAHKGEFKKASKLFEKSESYYNNNDNTWSGVALHNAIISRIWSGDTDSQVFTDYLMRYQKFDSASDVNTSKAKNNFKQLDFSDISFEKGLMLASFDKKNVLDELEGFLQKFPQDYRKPEVYLIIAEIYLKKSPPNIRLARFNLDQARDLTMNDYLLERADYLEIWADVLDGNLELAEKNCEKFLKTWPNSKKIDVVMMKRADILFKLGIFSSSEKAFIDITNRFTDLNMVNQASFYAGRSAMSLLTDEGLTRAKEIFTKLSEKLDKESLLYLRVKLYICKVLRLKSMNEVGLKKINELEKDNFENLQKYHNIYFKTLMLKNEFLNSNIQDSTDEKVTKKNLEFYNSILDNYKKIVEHPKVNKNLNLECYYKIGRIRELLQDSNSALDNYFKIYDNLNISNDKRENEFISIEEIDWIYKAGYRMIAIKEEKGDYLTAIKIANNLALNKNISDEIAEKKKSEALEIENALKLKYFIWE